MFLRLNKFLGCVYLTNVAIFQQFLHTGCFRKHNPDMIENCVEMIKLEVTYRIPSESTFFLRFYKVSQNYVHRLNNYCRATINQTFSFFRSFTDESLTYGLAPSSSKSDKRLLIYAPLQLTATFWKLVKILSHEIREWGQCEWGISLTMSFYVAVASGRSVDFMAMYILKIYQRFDFEKYVQKCGLRSKDRILNNGAATSFRLPN